MIERVVTLLEDGVPAESIGIVARDTAPYAAALRTHCDRLGVPFHAPGTAGPAGATQRRAFALLAVLAEGEAVPTDRWLDARAHADRLERADLRLALRAGGALRLGAVAAIDVAARTQGGADLSLPARVGLVDGEEDEAPVARRRRLPAAVLDAAVRAAQAACVTLTEWPAQARVAEHAERLQGLVERDLGWRDVGELAPWIAAQALELGDVRVSFEEFVILSRRAAEDAAASGFGGEGGGVRVLGLVEARAQTFAHLFVLGANRGRFPLARLEDPLFPDAVRRPLEPLLPEIPLRSRGFEEEHHLFAQLVSSGDSVTLCWQVADDEGRASAPSPFVERMRGAGALPEPLDVPGPLAPGGRGRLRTAAEAAIVEGLYGAAEQVQALWPLAAAEAIGRHPDLHDLAAPAWADARRRALDELGARPEAARLGPLFGFVGARRGARDARDAPLFVTHLERMLRCPWQHFLTQVLRVEPAPAPQDVLPGPSALLVGTLVHDVLEGIVRDALGATPPAQGAAVAWPDDAALDRRIARSAAALVAEEGVSLPGFDRLLAALALPLVRAAREQGWPGPDSDSVCEGAEQAGELSLGESGRTLHFRADRIDRDGTGPVLTDYKTGRVAGQRALSRDIARGVRLQAAAYAFASGGEGRYVYLAAGAAPSAIVSVDASDAALREAFDNVVEAAWVARDAGAFVPRLTEPGGTQPAKACQHCEVREACVQGDAGARARFAAWAERSRGETPVDAQALALLRVVEGGAR